MRDTKYAKELATAVVKVTGKGSVNSELRVERLFIKEHERDEVRWSWWKDGNMANRPADMTEEQLLELVQRGMAKGVFSTDFLVALKNRVDTFLLAK